MHITSRLPILGYKLLKRFNNLTNAFRDADQPVLLAFDYFLFLSHPSLPPFKLGIEAPSYSILKLGFYYRLRYVPSKAFRVFFILSRNSICLPRSSRTFSFTLATISGRSFFFSTMRGLSARLSLNTSKTYEASQSRSKSFPHQAAMPSPLRLVRHNVNKLCMCAHFLPFRCSCSCKYTSYISIILSTLRDV